MCRCFLIAGWVGITALKEVYMVTLIKKRDGSVVEFNRNKIRAAMEKAAESINANVDVRPFGVMADHAARHVEIHFVDTIPDVETVQDLVEKTLMEFGLFEVAKAYILYRSEHTKLRDEQTKESVSSATSSTFSYVAADGQSKPLTASWVKNRLALFIGDLPEIDRPAVTELFMRNAYEGMSEAQADKALLLAVRAFIERDPAYSTLATRLGLQGLYKEVLGDFGKKDFEAKYRQAFKDQLQLAVSDGRLVTALTEFDVDGLADYLDLDRDDLFDYMGFETLYGRYFLRAEGNDHIYETPQAFWMRVAMGMAQAEGEAKNDRAKQFYDVMSTLRYVPSTPTLFHSGTTYPQLSSCYLNTVEDDLGHIFKVFGDNAQLAKYSGGIGTDWTNIRATGALIKTTNVSSQGIVPFLKVANDATHAINRSGKRRGAACVYLETWHLDIEDFLDLRRNTGDERRRTHDMNTANWVPDLFMQRVIEGKDWTLFSPDEAPDLHHIYGQKFVKAYKAYEKKAANGQMKLYKTVPAKDLWRKMITMLFETGHPWITWKDPSNVRSPQDHVGVIHNSNLCTEITLNTSATETAVCNLGSINLAKHMKGKKLDTAKLAETTKVATRMLDNVIDVNLYPTVEAKQSNLKHRPVGLGIMGFQDALYLAGINFDSDEAVALADESMEHVAYHAILGSSELAKERGAYESYKGSKWDRGIFPIDTLDLLEAERGTPIGVDRISRLDWAPVRKQVKEFGMRNSNTMAIAPTATISNISGCYPCIEPIYKNLYVKSNMSGEFTVINKYLIEDLKELGLWTETMIEELKRHDGSVQQMTIIPPKLRAKYKEVFEVGPEALVKVAAHRGKWIDQSQSLNIFLQGTSGKRLSDVYMLAWHLGLKTTYYLRTMAATSVEKSTLDLVSRVSAAGVTDVIETVVEMPTVKEEVAVQVKVAEVILPEMLIAEIEAASFKEMPKKIEAPVMSVPAAPKACLIADPDCEACQ